MTASFTPIRPDIKISAAGHSYSHNLSLDLSNNTISKSGINEAAWRDNLNIKLISSKNAAQFAQPDNISSDIVENAVALFPGDIVSCSTGIKLIQESDPPAYFQINHKSTRERVVHGGVATAVEADIRNARAYGSFIPHCKTLPILKSKQVFVLDTYEENTIHVNLINHNRNSIVIIPHNYLVLEVDLLFKVVGFN